MSTVLPRIRILATGGTISGVGRHRLDYVAYGETGQRLTIQEMLALATTRDRATIQRLFNEH